MKKRVIGSRRWVAKQVDKESDRRRVAKRVDKAESDRRRVAKRVDKAESDRKWVEWAVGDAPVLYDGQRKVGCV